MVTKQLQGYHTQWVSEWESAARGSQRRESKADTDPLPFMLRSQALHVWLSEVARSQSANSESNSRLELLPCYIQHRQQWTDCFPHLPVRARTYLSWDSCQSLRCTDRGATGLGAGGLINPYAMKLGAENNDMLDSKTSDPGKKALIQK